MTDIEFEWDEAKSRENKRKHGVSFEEAQTVFLDENAIRFADPDHSTDEDRFLMLGISFQLCAIAFGQTMPSSGSFPQERQTKRKRRTTGNGDDRYEEALRLWQNEGSAESLRQTAQATYHDPLGQGDDRLLQSARRCARHALPEPDQPLLEGLCSAPKEARVEVGIMIAPNEPFHAPAWSRA
jgi:hypothetical protein